MKEIDLWKFIDKKLKANQKLILMVVAESSKSSPGRAGFKMAISSDNELAGTVGGGIMEFNLLEECRKYLSEGENISIVKKLFHNKTSPGEKSGLMCGGTQTMILKSIGENEKDFISGLIKNYDNLNIGTLTISNSSISFDNSKINDTNRYFNYESENKWIYDETSGFPNTVYVIGGGHVGLAVSKVLSTLDFYIVTIDPRKDVFTMTNNIYADKKIFIPYENVGKYIIESDRSYATIVTSDRDSDLTALKSIIHKKLRYIGLMGSKSKIKSIFNKVVENGVDPELLKQVHTPIGIEIEAESPEEIGISIAAEIIKIKNQKMPVN